MTTNIRTAKASYTVTAIEVPNEVTAFPGGYIILARLHHSRAVTSFPGGYIIPPNRKICLEMFEVTFLRKLAAAGALAASALGVSTMSSAHAATVPSNGVCTLTAPTEYRIIGNMKATHNAGSTAFSAVHNQPRGWWQFEYLSSGDEQGHNAGTLCNAHKSAGGVAVDLPARLSTGVTLTGDLHATALGSGVRLGYDIWLTTSQGYSTAKTMEAHSSTYEIMVQPGRSGHTVSNTRWHRIYVSTPHAANGGVNLTSIIRSLHIPSSYYVEAVNAGAETNAGNFRVSSYWLKASFPATAGAGYNAHAVKSYKGVSASAWFYSYARRSGSGSTPAAAQANARSNAQWQAWHNAVIGADARAKSAAVHAWQVKHGYRWAPYVVGKRVSQAEYLLRRAGFHTWNYYVPRHRTGIVTSQGNRFVAPHAWIGLRYKVRK